MAIAAAMAICLWSSARPAGADPLSTDEVSGRIDVLVVTELLAVDDEVDFDEEEDAAPISLTRIDDEGFLRRAMLDLVGEPPTPEEMTAFLLDSSPDKRRQVVDRLLDDARFGRNWGRYWRDTILYRRSEERALLAWASGEEYLAQQFNRGTPWDQIARDLITADGDIGSDGSTVLMAAQWNEVPDRAAEVSRVLMGIQIQCAQCHDHPTDNWTRDQFHELAAFFPRARIRRVTDEEGRRRGFEVFSADIRRGAAERARPGRDGEYYMPDLNDPAAPGTKMQPVFFATGQELDFGLSDRQRRGQLAQWMTSPDNYWFAVAFVNRIWTELVGIGFYEAVDDLGEDRPCAAPETLELLRSQFIEHGHDVKWLFRAIMATDVYQRATDADRGSHELPLADCVQRLRGDQLFDSLAAALAIDQRGEERQRGRRPVAAQVARQRTPRSEFNATFGFDPSTPSGEIVGSIPQALALMNAEAINRSLSAGRRGSVLYRLLERSTDNETILTELYLRTLAREPKQEELQVCLDYIAQLGNQAEALEDILWSLVNSTEFLYRN